MFQVMKVKFIYDDYVLKVHYDSIFVFRFFNLIPRVITNFYVEVVCFVFINLDIIIISII